MYLCNYQEKSYVAKIYRRDVAIKSEVMQALKEIQSPYVAHMIDTGMVDGKTVEILPYYENGSLQGKRLSYQELRETVIPCINEALRELHKIGVIHKDLKPSNIMRLDNGRDVAIIDFGISSVIDDGRTVLVTKTGMTPEYSAPETFRSVFLEESDYYSLGITLYELFCGRTPYAGMSNDEITQYMSIQKIPFPDEMPKALKELIAGLTYSDLANRNDKKNPNRRWTYEEVCNWCSGKYQPIPGEANMESNTVRIPAYKFRGELYTDTTELVQALASDWDNGKKQLYRGLLTGFFMACDPEIAEACMDAEDSVTKRGENEDVAFWKLLYKMSPDVNTFFWKNQKYESLNVFGIDLMEKLRGGNVEECPMWNEMLSYGLISSYMKAHRFSEAQVKGAESIESSVRLNKANELFESILGYKNVDELIEKQKFDVERQRILTARLGDIVTLGRCNDGDLEIDGEIKWIVLAEENGKKLIVSENILAHKKYHQTLKGITWEASDLREWLNTNFYAKFFTEQEKILISENLLKNKNNSSNNIEAGNDTVDKIFVLSFYEANRYFASTEKRSMKDWWWLRTPGTQADRATIVTEGGYLLATGKDVDKIGGVRPAIWVG